MKTDAIVLHALKYGESRMIVHLFCRETGATTVVAPMPKSPRGRIKKQYFQPMTLLDVEIDVRPTAQLLKLCDARQKAPYSSIPFSAEKIAIALFCAEFLYHALRAEGKNVALFDYVADAMQWLDASAADFANFHLTFLMRLSRLLGFFPNLTEAGEGSLFDLRAASFVAHVPLHRDYLSASESVRMLQLMRMDFNTMRLFRLSRNERNSILSVLLRYYKLHMPDFPELRSVAVLQELFV